jgi:2-C-methyl-D-erythritol 4-phosphate cytidylyltransferase
MKASAIIVAAGSGTRLGASIAKAFVPLNGATLLAINLRTISQVKTIGEVIVTVPHGLEDSARAIASAMRIKIPVKVVAGGEERQDSVRMALAFTSVEAELVAIHDAARPLAIATLFDSCIKQAETTDAAIMAVPVADTLKRVVDGTIQETIPRAELWQAQTPQVFRRNLIMRAHENALNGKTTATDDADLVERIGGRVTIVESSPLNFKITTADDLRLAEMVLAAQSLH